MSGAKRASGPSGAHKRAAVMLLRPERDGQGEEWRAAAARAGLPLAVWVRRALDAAAVASLKQD